MYLLSPHLQTALNPFLFRTERCTICLTCIRKPSSRGWGRQAKTLSWSRMKETDSISSFSIGRQQLTLFHMTASFQHHNVLNSSKHPSTFFSKLISEMCFLFHLQRWTSPPKIYSRQSPYNARFSLGPVIFITLKIKVHYLKSCRARNQQMHKWVCSWTWPRQVIMFLCIEKFQTSLFWGLKTLF